MLIAFQALFCYGSKYGSALVIYRHLLTTFSAIKILMQSKTDNGLADISKTFVSFCQLKTILVSFMES